MNGCGDGIDTEGAEHVGGSRDRDRVPITEQMPRRCGPHGVASITWRHIQAAVGLAVTFIGIRSRRPWPMHTSTYSVLNVSVGRVNRSAAHK